MADQRLLASSNVPVHKRLKTWLNTREVNVESFRRVILGSTIALSMGEVVISVILRSSIKYAQMPYYTMDCLIMTVALLEAAMYPVWSWFVRRRRLVLMICNVLPAIAMPFLLAAPAVDQPLGGEFCTNSNARSQEFSGMSSAAAWRLSIAAIVAVTFAVCRSAITCLSFSFIDEASSQKTSLNYGILITARVLALLTTPKVMDEVAVVQIIMVTGPLLVHVLQLYRVADHEPLGDNKPEINFCAAAGRVLSPGVAVSQMAAMSLMAAALWGFIYHETDIKKSRYLLEELTTSALSKQSYLILHWAVILAAVCYGIYYSRSLVFDRVSALKLSTFAAVMAVAFYCIVTMALGCTFGSVAGLDGNYTQPSCSSRCGCAMPGSEFAPVCLVDTMTTYLSPCHAGCAGTDIIQEITVFRNCGCAPLVGSRRAVSGPCAAVNCTSMLFMHTVLSALLVTLTVVALQAQFVIILRSLRPYDTRLGVGLTLACVVSFTFCGAHLVYFGIQWWTCSWFEGGRCHLQTPDFVYGVGGTSAGLALLAAIISLVTWQLARRRANKETKDKDFAVSEMQEETSA